MVLYSFASLLLGVSFLATFTAALFLLSHLYLRAKPFSADGSSPEAGNAFVSFSRFSETAPVWAGRLTALPAVSLSIASLLLLYAFINHDFIVEYVAQYSDRTLPIFYRITAFWAGQAGSLLFWAWAVAMSGVCFVLMPAYKKLSRQTTLWFCLFFFCIMAFFFLVLAVWSNPFATLDFLPRNGRGLNPLLQNPGMIFHPPLLFLGYGGFVVPGCLALAQTLSGRLRDPQNGERGEEPWEQASRPFILVAWSLLTAGIVLGAWWAYRELGWGGYWAWDPVENASLIPWLVASAYLHTAVIGSRRGKLPRTNVFLMALTTISAFFATYLVRSGVVQSLHAFGDGGVGTPLLLFTLAFLYLAAVIVLCEPGHSRKPPSVFLSRSIQGLFLVAFCLIASCAYLGMETPVFATPMFFLLLLALPLPHISLTPDAGHLEDLTSKEGLLLIVAWLLLALSLIILAATLWPVIMDTLTGISDYLPEALRQKLPGKPMGLEPAFYNRTCLPLFALLAVLLVACPYRKWKIPLDGGGFSQGKFFAATLGVALTTGAGLWLAGIHQPVALTAAACSIAALCGIILRFVGNPSLLSVRSTLAAYGTHAGLLMLVVGVAFSGPYQRQHTLELSRGQAAAVDGYTVLLHELYEGESPPGPDGRPNFRFLEAELLVTEKSGAVVGGLSPQRRLYANFETQTYAEVSTLFSLGNELYATLLSIDGQNRATIALNVNPLINWLWIGGTLMCVFPFVGLTRVRRMRETE
jgi:cytochrome c-type biogenesis protein CcmF